MDTNNPDIQQALAELETATLDQAELETDTSDQGEVFPEQTPLLGINKTVLSVDPIGDGLANQVGDVINYQITVTNSGNQTLNNVLVTDPLTGLSETIPSLAPGDSQVFTTSYTLTQQDIDTNGGGDGTLDNTATVDSDETDPSDSSTSTTIPQNPLLGINKTVLSVDPIGDGLANQVGDVINYQITVTNSGNQTLNNVLVTDPLTGLSETIPSLAPGDSQVFTTSYTLTQQDIDTNGGGDGTLDNTATVDSDETDPSDSSTSTTIPQNPLLGINKTVLSVDPIGDGLANQVGDVINYQITVTNSGNQTLNNVLVTDPLTGLSETIPSLAPGDSQVFTTSYTLTQQDIDTNGGGDGTLDNTATVDSDETDPSDSSTSTTIPQNPLLGINKTVLSVDPIGDGLANQVGDVINYQITVTNSGNQTLNNVLVTDPLTGLSETIPSLAPGDSQVFNTSYTLTQQDIDTNGGGDGTLDNTATVDSDETDPSDSSTSTTIPQNPLLGINKTVLSVDPIGDGLANQVGDVINYQITVTNSGNQTLNNVLVTDPLTGLSETIPSLAPGDSQVFTTSYTLTQQDIDTNGGGDGTLDNTATVDSDETDPSDSSTSTTIPQNPLLGINKTVLSVDSIGDGLANQVGDVINYQITVTNSGNQTLNNVLVTDPLTGLSETIPSLAPGDSQVFTTSYTLTQQDIDTNGGGDGTLDNTATVDSDETDPSDSSTSTTIPQNPLLGINKTVLSVDPIGDGLANQVGDVINYQITVTNSGNQTLNNVLVTDPLTGLSETIPSLAPGDSQVFNTSYTLTQQDIDTNGGGDGTLDNTATVDSDETDPSDSSTSTTIPQNPLLGINKTVLSVDPIGDGLANQVGDVINYQITVTNSGNQTLNNVLVTDPLTGLSETIPSLAPGDSQVFTTSYTLTQQDIDTNGGGDGTLDNTATVDSDETDPSDSSTSTTIPQNPLLGINKTVLSVDSIGDGLANQVGDVINYQITVTNSGNQTLNNVLVTDPLTGLSETIPSLAPGDSQVFTTSYTLTQQDIDTNGGGDGTLDNTATVDSDETDPSDSSTSTTIPQNPLLGINKTVLSVDPIGDGLANQVGDVINYQITVTNSGNQTLNNVLVTDPLTGLSETIPSLAPGYSQVFTTSYTLTQQDIDTNGGGDGTLDNTATVDSDETDPSDSSTSTTIPQNPLLGINKTVLSVDPIGDGLANQVGDVINYQITVTNSGNRTLNNVLVTDPLTGLSETIPSLAPGDSQVFTTSYTLTQQDIDTNGGGDGTLDNTATVDSDETDPSDSSTSTTIPQNPLLGINKTVLSVDPIGDGLANQVGDVINYQITVTNSGNQTLNNVLVTDPLTGLSETIPSLAPGDSQVFTTSYTLTQQDIDTNGIDAAGNPDGDGDIDNTATADSDQTDPVSDSEAVPIIQDPVQPTPDPSLSIDKQVIDVDNRGPTAAVTAAGQVITYDLIVTNNGNTTLTGITVVDPLTGTNVTVGTLDPGESSTVSAQTYTTTQNDIDSDGIDAAGNPDGDGDIDNTATADSDQTDPVSDSEAVPIIQDPVQPTPDPSLSIDKQVIDVDGNGPTAAVTAAGQVITYDLIVTNNGNTTLTGVTVVDPLTETDVTIGTLDPGESSTVSAQTYTTTQNDIDSNGIDAAGNPDGDGDIDNTATADSNQTGAVTDSEAVPIIQDPVQPTPDPSLSIDKQVIDVDNRGPDAAVTAAGQVITYDLIVTNNGNTTLTGVTVVDPLTGTNVTIGTLDPGESSTVSAQTYTTTQNDIDANGIDAAGNPDGDGDIDNTATADSDQTDPVSDSEAVLINQDPSLSIDKQVIDVDGNGPTAAVTEAGQVITYDLIVTNNGNTTLTGITVVDPLTDTDVTIGTLAPGESFTVSAQTYTTTQNDIDSNGIDAAGNPDGDGDIDNTATADSNQTGAVTDSEAVPITQDPSLSIDKQVIDVDGNGPTAAVTEAGQVIIYDLIVTNNGNTTLTGVTVVDPLTGTNVTIGTLDPGESSTVSAQTYTTTQNDIDSNGIDAAGNPDGDGDIDNTATADSNQTDPVSDSEAVPINQDPSLSIDKQVIDVDNRGPDAAVTEAGQVIIYDLIVTNNGNTTLTGVTVVDPLTDTDVTIGTLAPGESFTVSAQTYTTTQNDIDSNGIDAAGNPDGDGDIDNTATADSNQTGAVTDSEAVPIIQDPVQPTPDPSLSIDKQVIDVDNRGPDAAVTAAGQVITYDLIVTNNGNTTLTGVTVVDPLTGTNVTIGTLDPGESSTVSAQTYTTTQNDIDANGIDAAGNPDGDGDIDNTATADSNQTDPVSDSEAVLINQDPSLSIDKQVIDVDGNGPTAAVTEAGQVITYDLIVTNNGNTTLTGITVVDPLTDTDVTIGTLAPGESFTVSAQTYTTTQNDIDTDGAGDGDIDNTATADSDQTGAVTDSEAVPITQDPSLSIDKQVIDVDGNGPTAAVTAAGQVITYDLIVTNNGNTTLTGVTVVDPLTGTNVTVGTLDPGESSTVSAQTYTTTQNDIDANGIDAAGNPDGDGDIDNTATADSNQTDPVSDSEAVPIIQGPDLPTQEPSLSIDKQVIDVDGNGPTAAVTEAGQVITYDLIVTNNGNTTLTGVTVVDPLTGTNVTIGTLDPGESSTVSAQTYTTTQNDIDANGIDAAGNPDGDGDIDNTATADSDQTDPVSDSEAVLITQDPSLSIDKQVIDVDGNGPTAAVTAAGQVITYDLIVTNNGNTTLTGVTVVDPLTETDVTIGTLDPGESSTVSAQTYTTTQNDIDSNGIDAAGNPDGDGDIDNTATADSNQTGAVTDSEAVPITQDPSLSIDKQVIDVDGNGPTAAVTEAGQVIIYDLIVTNNGNTTLTGVTVVDPLTGTNVTIGTLDPGESSTVSAQTYTTTQNDIDSNGIDAAGNPDGDGDIDNTATADSNQTDPVSDSEAVPIIQGPDLPTQEPSLSIDKQVIDVDGNGPTAAVTEAGQVITYDLIVTNNGNTTLTGVTVVDPLTGTNVTVGTLDPGESSTVSAQTYTTTQNDIDANGIDAAGNPDGDGDIDNTATADSNQTGAVTDSEAVPITQDPSLSIDKQVIDVDGNGPTAAVTAAGQVITYDLIVTNNGNTTLTGVTVVDPLTGTNVTIGTLDPGESSTVSAQTYTTTQNDIDANGIDAAGNPDGDGDIDNTATADSDQTGAVTDSEAVPIIQGPDLPTQEPSLSIDKQVIDVDGNGPTAAVTAAGQVITYDLIVTNNGNTTLTGVTVVDPLTGTNVTVGTLDPGESSTVSAQTYTTTQNDIDANGIDAAGNPDGDGDIDNTATADSDQTGAVTDSEAIPITQDPSLSIDKQVIDVDGNGPTAAVTAAGQVITYDLIVTNNGNTTLTGVTVVDPLTGTNVTIGTLDPGESSTVSAQTYTTTQNDIDANGIDAAGNPDGDGDIDNTATADSDQTGAVTDSEAVPITQDPSLSIDKQVIDVDGNGPTAAVTAAGQVITYDLIVTNNGNTTLTGVTVVDPLTGTNVTVGTLDPGESSTVSAQTYTTTQNDIDSNGIDAAGNPDGDGDIDNTATADSDQTGAVTDSEAIPITQDPSLSIDKQVIDVDNRGPDAAVTAAGQVITYDLIVTNNGNTTLTGVTVVDPLTGTNVTIGTLDPGESSTVSAQTYTTTQNDIDANGIDAAGNPDGDGDIDNTATADSDQTDPVSDSEAVPIIQGPDLPTQEPSLSIDKQVIDVDGNGPTAAVTAAGQVITYDLIVTNNGNTTLTGVTVVDPLTGTDVTIGTLAPGESFTVSAQTYTTTQQDIDANGIDAAGNPDGDGDIDNTATADSNQTGAVTDSEAVPITQDPSLSIDKQVIDVDGNGPTAAVTAAGQVITYDLIVTNNGNTTLTGVTVVDPLTGTNVTIGTLDPGESSTVSAQTYTTTQNDIDSDGIDAAGNPDGDGDIDNTATADSDQTGAVTDSEAVPITQDPSLSIDKQVIDVDGNGPTAAVTAAGQVITYDLIVTNNGNTTLTGVTVVDPLTGTNVTVGTLDPGESSTVSAQTYTTTQQDIDSNGIDAAGNPDGDGDIDNTATADSDQTGAVTDSEAVPITQDPSLSIDKQVIDVDNRGPDAAVTAAGQVITYDLIVTNNGNTTLTAVTVVDPLTGTDVTIGTLDPGESSTVSAQTYTTTQNDIDSNGIDAAGNPDGDGDIDNTATADSDQTDPVSDSEEVPLSLTPGLTISKTVVSVDPTGDAVANQVGDVINYQITVTNNGNQTLTNVSVVDPLTGLDQTINSLAPGASQDFNTSYTLTQQDIDSNGIDAAGNPDGDGDIDNTATADSNQTGAVTDSEAVPITQNSSLSIDKQVIDVGGEGPTGAVTAAGQVITYDLIVTNNGNTTLTGITVVDPLTGTNVTVDTLAPGESSTVSAQTYTTTQNDIDTAGGGDGDIDNTATADSDQTDPVSDSEEVPIITSLGTFPPLNADISRLLTEDKNTILENDTDSVFVNVRGGSGSFSFRLDNNTDPNFGTWSINESTGEISFTQTSAFQHSEEPNPQTQFEASFVNVLVSDLVTGNTVRLRAVVDITDDGPTVSTDFAAAALTLDEDDLSNGSDQSDPTSVSGSLFSADNTGSFSFGADNGSITAIQFGTGDSATTVNLGSENSTTVFFAQDGTQQGTSSTDAAASLLVNADGTYTFNLLDNLLLPNPPADNGEQTENLSSINGGIVLLGQDNDGDLINSGNGIALTLNVVDDIPTASSDFAAAALTLDEDDLSNGSDQSDPTSVSGSLFSADNTGSFSFGADNGSITAIQFGTGDSATTVNLGSENSTTVFFAQDGTQQGTSSTDAAASLLVNSDGTYTFNLLDNLLLPNPPADNGEQTENLSSINGGIVLLGQDNDGDLINSGNGIALTLNVVDDIPTASSDFAAAALTLDEDDLSNGSDQSDPTSVSGSLFSADNTGSFSFGADGGSITGIAINGVNTSLGSETSTTVFFAQNGTSLGTTSSGAAASLLVNADGTYTFSLLNNLLLDGTNNGQQTESLSAINNNSIVLLGQDNDGDLINSGNGIALTLNVVDDVPTAFTPDNVTLINSGSANAQDSNFNITTSTTGADQEDANLTFTTNDGDIVLGSINGQNEQQLTSGGLGLAYYVSDDRKVLTASTSTTEPTNSEDTSIAYTIEINGDTTTGFTYDVITKKTIDNGSGLTFDPGTAIGPSGGNPPYEIIANSGDVEILVTGYDISTIANNGDVSQTSVNVNDFSYSASTGSGLRGGQNLVLDYGTFSIGNPDSSFIIDSRIDIIAPKFTLVQGSPRENLTVAAVNANGSTTNTNATGSTDTVEEINAFTIVRASDESAFTRTKASGSSGSIVLDSSQTVAYTFNNDGTLSLQNINAGSGSTTGDSLIVFANNTNRLVIQNDKTGNSPNFSIAEVEVGNFDAGNPVSTNIDVALKDGDGDQSNSAFAINFNPDLPTNTNPPITIDLDGNGISYLSLEDDIQFTDINTLETIQTAWVASNDGILVYDANQSGSVETLDEFVLTRLSTQASTDLEALAEVFDTNQDGILNALDTDFESFAIWQDLNSDGMSDDGELISLSDLSIKSIDLRYFEDSQSRIDGEGDVEIFGQFNINYEDGSIGLAEDASFAFRSVSEEQVNSNYDLISSLNNSFNGKDADITNPSNSEKTDISAGELVDQFLAINTVSNELLSEMQQELSNIDDDLNAIDTKEFGSQDQDNSYQANISDSEELDLETDLDIDIIESILIDNFDPTAQTPAEDEAFVYS
ncbi:beta strand repeat-containing protein [Synechococcus sp. WH 8017]|uniref:beta strand repeat-containing protein n=1 Tax=Synechococcus sp. WH 8017 TaxID=166321 RepID=UPI0039A45505